MERRASRKTRGAAMMELALLSPWIIFLFIGAFDWGFYAYSLITLETATRAAGGATPGRRTTAAQSTPPRPIPHRLQHPVERDGDAGQYDQRDFVQRQSAGAQPDDTGRTGWLHGIHSFGHLHHAGSDPDTGSAGEAVHHHTHDHHEDRLSMLPNTEKKRRQRGAAMVEFTIAGVAALTLMVSTVQIGLGMWNYHTLAYAVHETNRYISTHGRNCSLGGNTCTITVADIANKMINNGVGLPSGSVIMTLTSNSGTVYTCNPVSSCTSDSTQWPPIAHLDNYP